MIEISEKAKVSRTKRYVTVLNRLVLALLFCVAVIGCEKNLQPLKENNEYIFSIYGYLDASADTQWVRIMPPRKQLESLAEKPGDVRVTLEELESSNTVLMNDSLMKLINGVNVVNYWTTMDIKPEHTYRLIAENAEGMASQSTVSIPGNFPTPELQYRFKRCNGFLFINGVNKLADVQSVWHYKINVNGEIRHRVGRYGYRNRADQLDSESFQVLFKEYEHTPLPAGEFLDVHREFFIASGGPGWNEEISTLSDLEYALPEGISNIKNGVGYLAGILSKTVPSLREYIFNDERSFVSCFDPTASQQQKGASDTL